jgi:D-aspartate ligase
MTTSGGSADSLALVMGDVDLVRALGIAGISAAFLGSANDPARFSRHVRVSLPCIDDLEPQESVVAGLLAFASSQAQPPVLFPQTDASLLLASRHRDRLRDGFRLILADPDLVEQLVDKGRFQALAARHELPVPRAQRLDPGPGRPPPALEVPFPLVTKPLVRTPGWKHFAGAAKALHVPGGEEFVAIWPRLAGIETAILAQELIRGPERCIESFHAYVDESGAIPGEFTGRKIRTLPTRYGHSTAVEITLLPDVAELGHEVLARLGLRGVAKLDFKRDDRGRLHLLEVNPRFNLWHYPGAVAGVNLPALVYADLTGRKRPPAAPVPQRVMWCDPLPDVRAAYTAGTSPLRWLRWACGCRAVCGLAWEDPLPFVRGMLWPSVRRRVVPHRLGDRHRAAS